MTFCANMGRGSAPFSRLPRATSARGALQKRPRRTDHLRTTAVVANRRRETALVLKVMIISLVLFQRFAVPGLSTAMCAAVVLALTGYLAARHLIVEDVRSVGAYLVAIVACSAAAVASALFLGAVPSLTSLALLVVLYLPFCFRLPADAAGLQRESLEFFNRLMLPLAGVALVQWGAQVSGWRYADPLAALPRQLLLQTYNTFYPIHYGSRIMKTNAIVFLEPSFCSQYLALALVIQLLLGGNLWRLPVYAAALMTTVSGTGLVLLGVGLAVLAVRRGGRWAVKAIVILAVSIALLALTPVTKIYTARSAETTTVNSSGNARFVAPYVQVVRGFAKDVPTMLFGLGPGAVSRSTGAAFFNPEELEVNYPALPKLAAEYGLFAAIAFAGFIASVIVAGARSPTLAAVLLLLYFVLSGSLLQPATTLTCLVFASFFRPQSASSACLNDRLGKS